MTQAITEVMDKGISQSNKSALRNPWVLGWLALVIVVFGVNIGFVTMAVLTNPGLVDKHYYEKGQDYEQNMLKQMAERNALGWVTAVDVPPRIIGGTKSPYRLTIKDKDGQPVTGAEVVLEAYRPADAKADFSLSMREEEAGRYSSDLTLALKGVWELRFRVKQGERNYEVVKRVSVQAP